MYGINYLIVLTLLSFGCGKSDCDQEMLKPPVTDTIPLSEYQKHPFFNKDYFSKSDAEKILGEPANLSDSSAAIKKDTFEIKTTYTANVKDSKTGKIGNIYFMIEEYNEVAAAKNAYNIIKVANANHQGVKVLQGIGDEAYFHSDGSNFYFVLVRKEKIMFRMKVNKITSHTSLDAFNMVAKKITDNL